MPTITIITNYKKRMSLWVCVGARNVHCSECMWTWIERSSSILHCIRLQSNVRQFRSDFEISLFKQFKKWMLLPNDYYRCRWCCCCCYSYCICNDVPENITSIVRKYSNLTSLLCEWETHSYIHTLFVLLWYAFSSLPFWIKEQTVNTIYYRWLGAMLYSMWICEEEKNVRSMEKHGEKRRRTQQK